MWHRESRASILVVQRVLENTFGYRIDNDLDIFARINGLRLNREKMKEIGGYIYFEVFWEKNPQYKMLCRVPTNMMTVVRDGVEVFWFSDAGANIGPSIDFDTMASAVAAGTWAVLRERLLETHRITGLTPSLWSMLIGSSDALNLHPPPP